MATDFTTEEIKRKYNDFASTYTTMERVQELLGLRKLRQRLLQQASGEVLEVACGTGANFPYYSHGRAVTAVDLSPAMVEIAEQRAETVPGKIDIQIMDAERLAFSEESFDTVVSTLTLCTFPDPIAALEEMERVCREDGRILLLEHGRSDNRLVGRFQDFREDAHAKRPAVTGIGNRSNSSSRPGCVQLLHDEHFLVFSTKSRQPDLDIPPGTITSEPSAWARLRACLAIDSNVCTTHLSFTASHAI